MSTSTALCAPAPTFLQSYKGTPFHDSHYHGGAQKIPGRVQCAYFDLGGDGVAYHNPDSQGGMAQKNGTYLNTFRASDGVQTSYTKFEDQIDNSSYNPVQPTENQLYVGWTRPGEWFNITVQVAKAGTYTADLFYASSHGGTISIDVNGVDATGQLVVPGTFDANDPISWRQSHHWNLEPQITQIQLSQGKNILTIHVLPDGSTNLAYFDFKPASQ